MPENKEWTMTFTSADINKDAVKAVTGIDPEEEDDLLAKIEHLKRELDSARVEREQAYHRAEIRYRDGLIEGLKYSIRCNGVSGADVR